MNSGALKSTSLDAPIAKVKYLLENIIAASNGAYQLKEKKQTPFALSLLLHNSHFAGDLRITLTDAGNSKTLWLSQISDSQNSDSSLPAFIEMQDELLAIVQEGLEGKPIITRFIREDKKSTLSRVSKAFGSLLHFS